MSSRGEQLSRARAAQRLIGALLEITYRCNWRCTFCYNPRHFDRQRMSAAEWSIVLDDLRALGAFEVTLTGGEPLTYPQFFQIASAVRERYLALYIFTNGSLIDEGAADAIAALTPVEVEISIHGANAVTHGATTGAASSLERSMRGARLLAERGVRVKVKTVLTRSNESELHAMRELAESAGARFQVDPVLLPRDDGDLSPLQEHASDSGLRDAYRFAAAAGALDTIERRQGMSNCSVGRSAMAIDPEGNVYPCSRWRTASAGNVREKRLIDIWPGSPLRAQTADIALAANDALYARGDNVATMPFCPAVALQRRGDPLAIDEDLARRATIARAVLAETS